MSDLQTEQHRKAWAAVVEVLPGAEFVSHEVELSDSELCSVRMPTAPRIEAFTGCPRCGDPKDTPGLNTPGVVEKVLCRDWHDICQCGAPYGQPKNEGCRRLKRAGGVAHPKEEK